MGNNGEPIVTARPPPGSTRGNWRSMGHFFCVKLTMADEVFELLNCGHCGKTSPKTPFAFFCFLDACSQPAYNTRAFAQLSGSPDAADPAIAGRGSGRARACVCMYVCVWACVSSELRGLGRCDAGCREVAVLLIWFGTGLDRFGCGWEGQLG
jgi:hypothetical protein